MELSRQPPPPDREEPSAGLSSHLTTRGRSASAGGGPWLACSTQYPPHYRRRSLATPVGGCPNPDRYHSPVSSRPESRRPGKCARNSPPGCQNPPGTTRIPVPRCYCCPTT